MRTGYVVVLALLALGTPGLAHADEASDKAAAKTHYAAGLRAYNTGDFDQAITEWKSSYRLLGTPDFLFNIAQAYRQKRDYDQAIFFYNAYLRNKPDAANLAEVTALRDEMQSLRDKQAANEKMPPDPQKILGPVGGTGPAGDPKPAQPPAEPVSEPVPHSLTAQPNTSEGGTTMRLTGLIVSATGLAFAAAGVGFAISASSTETDLEEAAAQGEPWSDSFADDEASGERNATIGTALIITGTAALIGGGVLYFLGHKRRADQRLSSVAPIVQTEQGTTVGLSVGMDF